MLHYRGLLVLLCCLHAAPAFAGETLTNASVKAMASAGLPDVVIVSKIERATETTFGLSAARVVLVTTEGEQPLRLQRGEMSTTGFGAFRLVFQDFPGLHAKVRTRNPRPVLLVRSAEALTHNRYFVARLDVDTDDECRSLKIGSEKSVSKPCSAATPAP